MQAASGGEHTSYRRSWANLGVDGAAGADNALALDGVDLWWIELPFVRPVGTAVGVHTVRPLILVRLRCSRIVDGAEVFGWGECAALGDTTYDTEDVSSVFATLESTLIPSLLSGSAEGDGALPSIRELGPILAASLGTPLAAAAMEMAVADAHLRASGRSCADLIGVAGARVEPGAVLGIPESAEQLLASVESLAAAGYVRVKVKVAPGTEFDTVSALAQWSATHAGATPRFQVDANGSYRPDQADLLVRLDPFGLLCIEQPFDRDDLDSHRALASRMTTPICLDESLDGPEPVVEAVTSGACSVACVKPARLGGIDAALEVIEWCTANMVPWWIGGMFESGYGRRVTIALGALPGLRLPGDLAPPESYLALDLVDTQAASMDTGSGRLAIAVSDVPGMGPLPDPDVLEACIVDRRTFGDQP